jgi:hypothetical protein
MASPEISLRVFKLIKMYTFHSEQATTVDSCSLNRWRLEIYFQNIVTTVITVAIIRGQAAFIITLNFANRVQIISQQMN